MTPDDETTREWTGGDRVRVPYLSAAPQPGEMTTEERRHKEVMEVLYSYMGLFERIADSFEKVTEQLTQVEKDLATIREEVANPPL